MSKATLDTIVHIAIPVIAVLLVFKDYIHIGKHCFTIPDVVHEDMLIRAKERNMGYLAFMRKIFRLALTLERIEADPKAKIIIEEEGKAPTIFKFQ